MTRVEGLSSPQGLAIDPTDLIAFFIAPYALYIADTGNARILKFHADSTSTVAGNGIGGFSGDGGPATQASLSSPSGVASDTLGNLFIADTFNHRIRRVDSVTKIITTVAGNGTEGFSGDGGLAAQASLSIPFDVALDGLGNLFIADSGNGRIRRFWIGCAPNDPGDCLPAWAVE